MSLISEGKLQDDLSPTNKREWLKYKARRVDIQKGRNLVNLRTTCRHYILKQMTYVVIWLIILFINMMRIILDSISCSGS